MTKSSPSRPAVAPAASDGLGGEVDLRSLSADEALEMLEALLEPPVVPVELPAFSVQWPSEDPLLQRMASGKETETFAMYQLVLRAEEATLRGRFDRLLCEEGLPGVCRSHQRVVRRIWRDMEGRALLAHEPGVAAVLELAMAVAEARARGIVQRVLWFAPKELGALRAAMLRECFGLTFVVADQAALEVPSILYEQLRKYLALPEELDPVTQDPTTCWMLPRSCLSQELPSFLTEHNEEALVVFEGAHLLRKRRQKPWKNLFALGTKYMLLEGALPFVECAHELHAVLALLGVPQLPPPKRLREELAEADASISPKTRVVMRPFLQPVLLRHPQSSTEIHTPAPQWKTEIAKGSQALRSLREHCEDWLRSQFDASAKKSQSVDAVDFYDTTQETKAWMQRLLLAVACSVPATAEALTQGLQLPELEAEQEALEALLQEARGILRVDPRLDALVHLLQQHARTRFLIFCHHESTRTFLTERLRHHGLLDQSEDHAEILLATDTDIPSIPGELDCVVSFDFPWSPLLVQERALWTPGVPPHEPHPRVARSLFLPKSPELALWETLDFRFKWTSDLLPGELPYLLEQLPPAYRFPQSLWTRLFAPETFIEDYSQALLAARKEYRKIRDQNQRLLLDDYAP